MSISLKIACRECGDIKVRPGDIVLYLGTNTASYRVVCPAGHRTEIRASDRIARVLVECGVAVVRPCPITEADVSAFVANLEHIDAVWGELQR